jgi:hypothetical protein
MSTYQGHILVNRAKKNGTDGRSISSVTKYYLATSAGSGITTSTGGWTTSIQMINNTSKYLWTYETITYSDGTSTSTSPVISGVYGDGGKDGSNGYNGCIIRAYQNGITVGQTYHNDQNDSSITGTRYLDIVLIADSSMTSGYAAYQCILTYTATATNDYSNTTYWNKLAENFSSAFFNYIIAKNAYLKLLSSAQIVVFDADGNETGGMQGDPTIPIFWAGATKANAASAPFRVLADGTVVGLKMQGLKGSFQSLAALDSGGNEAGNLSFGDFGLTFNNLDLAQQGTKNGRSLRFYMANVWCRQSFGTPSENTVRIQNGVATFYPDGLSNMSFYVKVYLPTTTYDGNTYYEIPLYPGAIYDSSDTSKLISCGGGATISDLAGLSINTVLFDNSAASIYYWLLGWVGQKADLINVNNNYRVIFAIAGVENSTIDGGKCVKVFNAANLLTPTRNNSTPGDSSWLIVGYFDNNWS